MESGMADVEAVALAVDESVRRVLDSVAMTGGFVDDGRIEKRERLPPDGLRARAGARKVEILLRNSVAGESNSISEEADESSWRRGMSLITSM
jgi:hypothetical protein